MEEAKGPNLSLGALTAPGERPLAGASAVAVTLAQQAPSTICVDQQAITGAHKVKVSGGARALLTASTLRQGNLFVSGRCATLL